MSRMKLFRNFTAIDGCAGANAPASGYDNLFTGMQETKVTLCQIAAA